MHEREPRANGWKASFIACVGAAQRSGRKLRSSVTDSRVAAGPNSPFWRVEHRGVPVQRVCLCADGGAAGDEVPAEGGAADGDASR